MKKRLWYRRSCDCNVWNVRYPCANLYTNRKTGVEIYIIVTPIRHCSLPSEVDSLKEVLNLRGVCKKIEEVDIEGRRSRIEKSFALRKGRKHG